MSRVRARSDHDEIVPGDLTAVETNLPQRGVPAPNDRPTKIDQRSHKLLACRKIRRRGTLTRHFIWLRSHKTQRADFVLTHQILAMSVTGTQRKCAIDELGV